MYICIIEMAIYHNAYSAGERASRQSGLRVFSLHPKYCQQYFKVFPRSSRSTHTASQWAFKSLKKWDLGKLQFASNQRLKSTLFEFFSNRAVPNRPIGSEVKISKKLELINNHASVSNCLYTHYLLHYFSIFSPLWIFCYLMM